MERSVLAVAISFPSRLQQKHVPGSECPFNVATANSVVGTKACGSLQFAKFVPLELSVSHTWGSFSLPTSKKLTNEVLFSPLLLFHPSPSLLPSLGFLSRSLSNYPSL